MARQSTKATKDIAAYAHPQEDRVNNPPVGLVTPETDQDADPTSYAHDPHLDPELSWAGKAENTSFEVPTVSLHVHERIDPRTIIEAVRKRKDAPQQTSLFASQDENLPIRHAIEFYKHKKKWTNRLVAGDSLLVMTSLLEKEGLGGQVQMVYVDPPYGIRYGSNFQPFVHQHQVTDRRDDDLTTEPEQIRAFRDTWELGIHSYLSYMRDRLLLARELLTESGSCFVQIGEENVHRVGLLMDEVFGSEHRIATISYSTTSGSSAKTLPQVADYLLWYARDRRVVKYRQLYEPLTRAEVIDLFSWHAMVQMPDGECRKLTDKERFDPDRYLPKGARLYRRTSLDSQGVSTTGRSEPYEWNGRVFDCVAGRHWSVSAEGMDQLAALGRLDAASGQSTLSWKRFENEVPGRRINNVWPDQMAENRKSYVVQTAVKPVQRCMLMTTDPGDLVLDPTCGSGTTAFVAEQWGRRWITCDTSRVATVLAKQRLMTANYDYYELAHPDEGVGSGLKCRRVRAVSARTLAYGHPPKEIVLQDRPRVDRTRARVTGPFTAEAVPAPTVLPIDDVGRPEELLTADDSVGRAGPTVRQGDWRDELLKTGVRGRAGQRISFVRLEPLPGTRWLHADGETAPDGGLAEDGTRRTAGARVVVSFGPDHAPMEQRQVDLAIEESQNLVPKPSVILFAAFQFDPEAAKDIDETEWPGVTLLKAQMNADLLTGDLKKARASNDGFWLIGQPDIGLKCLQGTDAGKYRVTVRGYDYYNTRSGLVESGDADRIAVWMLDPDYDGRSLFPAQVFFPTSDPNGGWKKLAKNLRAEIDATRMDAYSGTVSLPFESGEHGRAAVKVVDDRGVESLKIVNLSR